MTTRINYEHELVLLHQDLKKMGNLVETAIKRTFIAFETQNFDMAEEIIHGDRDINALERSIEARCLSLILRQQPVAGDLRIVSTALKVVTDLERIGDHASDIAELILRMRGERVYHMITHLPVMATAAQAMLHGAIEAFINQDADTAKHIIGQDDEVDELFCKVKDEVIELIKNSTEIPDQCIDFLMIAKYLERIGDHAVNVCEWVEFCKTGELDNIRIL